MLRGFSLDECIRQTAPNKSTLSALSSICTNTIFSEIFHVLFLGKYSRKAIWKNPQNKHTDFSITVIQLALLTCWLCLIIYHDPPLKESAKIIHVKRYLNLARIDQLEIQDISLQQFVSKGEASPPATQSRFFNQALANVYHKVAPANPAIENN